MKVKEFAKENWQLILVLIYLVSPIDLIPEAVLPVIGASDDLILVLIELLRRYYNSSKSE